MFKFISIMTALVVVLNLAILAVGVLSLMFSYYHLREFLFYILLIVGPLLSLYVLLYLARVEEQRLAKQVRMARLRKELQDLAAHS